nr:PREDICTED: uncharacterized protein LOC103279281 isoform X1 [Anolis carolinensis]|eukprot:XP_008111816.1 PREDICTED: uncharacterized protein LOC103279281 isoform X1 [Anolis carolinensis]
MESFRPPPPLAMQGNLAENWRRWEQAFQLYLAAAGLENVSKKRQIAILLHCVGEEGVSLYNTFVFAEENPKDIAEVLEQFRTYFLPRKNNVFERFCFWNHMQSPGVTNVQFIAELKLKAASCEFGMAVNEMIRDKVVFSLQQEKLKQNLLQEADLTLEKAVEICRVDETTRAQLRTMAITSEEGVFELQDSHGENKEIITQALGTRESRHRDNWKNQNKCGYCGTAHEPRRCPAFGKTCNKCGKKNHYARLCRSRVTNPVNIQARQHIHELNVSNLMIGKLDEEMKDTQITNKAGWIPINVRQDLQRAQERQKHFYDRTARPLKPLREGDLVWMQSNNCKERWLPAVVIEKCKQPRSYLIKNQDGRVYRRNRRQLKQRNQTPETTIQGNTTYNGSKGMFVNKSDAHVIADRKPTYVTSHGRPVFEPVRYTP